MAGTDVSLPARPINALLGSILAGEGRVLIELLSGRRRGYSAGVSLVAILRREAGEIVPRSKPGDVVPDLFDPATGRRNPRTGGVAGRSRTRHGPEVPSTVLG
jgi:hypothetical protein